MRIYLAKMLAMEGTADTLTALANEVGGELISFTSDEGGMVTALISAPLDYQHMRVELRVYLGSRRYLELSEEPQLP